MKKKMLTVVIVIMVVIVLILAGWYVAFCKFGVGPAFPFLKTVYIGDEGLGEMPIAENSLTTLVDSQEEAQGIAELYGITLVSFENGVAVYQTEEDPFEVIARGDENGYPQLSINFIRTLQDGEETSQVFIQNSEQIYYEMERE